MINYECISSRLLKVTINLRSDRIKYFVVYAPDSSYGETYVEEFFGTLQDEINTLPPSEHIVLLCNVNASVGNHMQYIWPEVVGNYGAGENNELGVKILQFCTINNLCIANTISKHKEMTGYIHERHQNVQRCKLILL